MRLKKDIVWPVNALGKSKYVNFTKLFRHKILDNIMSKNSIKHIILFKHLFKHNKYIYIYIKYCYILVLYIYIIIQIYIQIYILLHIFMGISILIDYSFRKHNISQCDICLQFIETRCTYSNQISTELWFITFLHYYKRSSSIDARPQDFWITEIFKIDC